MLSNSQIFLHCKGKRPKAVHLIRIVVRQKCYYMQLFLLINLNSCLISLTEGNAKVSFKICTLVFLLKRQNNFFVVVDHDRSWKKNSRSDFRIKFKARFDPRHEVIQGSELKVFKRLPRNGSMVHGKCSVCVYLIQRQNSLSKMIDTREVDAWKAGWQTFNVTAAMKLWAQYPLTNYGFEIVVHHNGQKLSPQAFGLVGTRGNLEKRPYLVGFVSTTSDSPVFAPGLLVPSRQRRAAKMFKYGNNAEVCGRKKFTVNFEEVGLHRTIIAPNSYDMYFCHGHCLDPLDPNKATNHAIVQSVYRAFDNTVDEPCCVPGILKAVNLLFYDDDGNIVMKRHPNMVAASCVCN